LLDLPVILDFTYSGYLEQLLANAGEIIVQLYSKLVSHIWQLRQIAVRHSGMSAMFADISLLPCALSLDPAPLLA